MSEKKSLKNVGKKSLKQCLEKQIQKNNSVKKNLKNFGGKNAWEKCLRNAGKSLNNVWKKKSWKSLKTKSEKFPVKKKSEKKEKKVWKKCLEKCLKKRLKNVGKKV